MMRSYKEDKALVESFKSAIQRLDLKNVTLIANQWKQTLDLLNATSVTHKSLYEAFSPLMTLSAIDLSPFAEDAAQLKIRIADVAKAILDAGIPMDYALTGKNNPLHLAINRYNRSSVSSLTPDRTDNVFSAYIHQLITHTDPIHIDDANGNGETVLMRAVKQHFPLHLIDEMLDKGADPQYRSPKSDKTVEDYAVTAYGSESAIWTLFNEANERKAAIISEQQREEERRVQAEFEARSKLPERMTPDEAREELDRLLKDKKRIVLSNTVKQGCLIETVNGNPDELSKLLHKIDGAILDMYPGHVKVERSRGKIRAVFGSEAYKQFRELPCIASRISLH